MIILSDMDGVVAEFVDVVLNKYNAAHGTSLAKDDITDERMHLVARSPRDIYRYFHEEGTFRDCPVVEGAPEVIDSWLDAGHEVYFVTKPVDHSLYCLKEKQAWVDQHFPRIGHKKVIFTGQKHLVRGDVLIEDIPANLQRFPGYGILFDQPWNQQANPDYAARHYSWPDIQRTVRELARFIKNS